MMLLFIHSSLVRKRAEYNLDLDIAHCCSVYGSCGESRRLTLEKLQNRAARSVTTSSYDLLADALV